MSKILFLIAGHSKNDSGAVTRNTTEAKEAMNIRNQIADVLYHSFAKNKRSKIDTKENDIHKIIYDNNTNVIVTDNDNDNLKQVVSHVNDLANKTDLLISFHFNAFNGKARGTEALVYHGANDRTKHLASNLAKVCSSVIKTPNRGVKFENSGQHSRLAILNDTKCNSILLEVCFVDSEKDMQEYSNKFDVLINKLTNTIKGYYE